MPTLWSWITSDRPSIARPTRLQILQIETTPCISISSQQPSLCTHFGSRRSKELVLSCAPTLERHRCLIRKKNRCHLPKKSGLQSQRVMKARAGRCPHNLRKERRQKRIVEIRVVTTSPLLTCGVVTARRSASQDYFDLVVVFPIVGGTVSACRMTMAWPNSSSALFWVRALALERSS